MTSHLGYFADVTMMMVTLTANMDRLHLWVTNGHITSTSHLGNNWCHRDNNNLGSTTQTYAQILYPPIDWTVHKYTLWGLKPQ